MRLCPGGSWQYNIPMRSWVKRIHEGIASKGLGYAMRLIKIVFGFTLLAIGVLMIFLPGPALVVIPISLAILAGEFVWARVLLRRVKRYMRAAREGLFQNGRDTDK